jgi:hypothetical protein
MPGFIFEIKFMLSFIRLFSPHSVNTTSMIRIWFCLFAIMLGTAAIAQTTFNGWVAVNNTFKVNKKFSIHLDVQARSTNQLDHLNTFIFRPGLNWHFRKNMIATVGYGFVSHRRTPGGVAGYSPEHRIWQQLIINHHAAFVAIQHRFRLEQRFIGNFGVVNGEFEKGGNRFANRFRYFARSIIPFNGSKPFARGVFGAVQNEVFLNLGNKTGVNGKFFDQNRLYLALGYRLSPKFDLETGYLNQYVAGAGNAHSRAHILQLATYLRL